MDWCVYFMLFSIGFLFMSLGIGVLTAVCLLVSDYYVK